MDPELESRLRESLGRHARRLPTLEGSVGDVRRRGRNRRWAVRTAGALGAVAISGAIAISLNRADGGQTVATADGRGDAGDVIGVAPTPTPTVAPTPTPVPVFVPPESEADLVDPPGDVTLLVATGWGSGLVDVFGNVYVPDVCCEDLDLAWYEQDRTQAASGAVRVLDDLRGGLVSASGNSLYWLPADRLGEGAEPVVAAVHVDESDGDGGDDDGDGGGSYELELWDVIELDDRVEVLYSVQKVSADGSEGSALLVGHSLAGGDSEVLARVDWSPDTGPGDVWAGAAWLPEGGWMSLKSNLDRTCEWVEFAGAGADLYSSPHQRPEGDDCPNPSMIAGAVSDEGLVVVSERYLFPEPVLGVYDRAGNRLGDIPLDGTEPGEGHWSELDIVGRDVLVSRGEGMDPTRWPELDETYLIDIETGDARPIPYWGAPSFARTEIAVDQLTAIEPTSPLYFGVETDPAGPEPGPTPDEAATPTPVGTPTTDEVPPETREPTGRLENVLAPGALAGDDGCLGTICLGMPLDEALEAATAAYGAEDTDTPEAELEGTLPPPSDHVFVTDAERVTVTGADGLVTELRSFPLADQASSPLGPLGVGEVLAALGAPAEVFVGDGEGIRALWLLYDTEASLVGYGFVEPIDDDMALGDEALGDGALGDEALGDPPDDRLLPDYDALPVNAYWARPAGTP